MMIRQTENYNCRLVIILILISVGSVSFSQSIAFHTNLTTISSGLVKEFNQPCFLKISVTQNTPNGKLVFSEFNMNKPDAAGNCDIIIGAGKKIYGNIDSVNWSDGGFFLVFESDTSKKNLPYFKYISELRIPSELNQNNLEGVATDEGSKGWGDIRIPNPKGQRPRKITLDLSTQYVNISYPADTYPIYRHYEWFDKDRNGKGNSFMLTYSEKTKHEFFENTEKLGEVKLYSKPFQELLIKGLDNTIEFLLTQPEKITNLSETYAIKGPWKMIYFIEW